MQDVTNNGDNCDAETPEKVQSSREIATGLDVSYYPNGETARDARQIIAETTHNSPPESYDKRERTAIKGRGNHSTKVSRETIRGKDGKLVRRYIRETNKGKYFVQLRYSRWSDEARKLFNFLMGKLCNEWRDGRIGTTELRISETEMLDVFKTNHDALRKMIGGATGMKMGEVEIGVRRGRNVGIAPIFSGKRGVKSGVVYFGVVNEDDEDCARIQSLMEYRAVVPASVILMTANGGNMVTYIFSEARMRMKTLAATGELTFTFEEISRAGGYPSPDDVDPRKVRQECIDPVFDDIEDANKTFAEEEKPGLYIDTSMQNGSGKPKEIFEACKITFHASDDWITYFTAKADDLQAGKDKSIKKIKDAARKREERARKSGISSTRQQSDEMDTAIAETYAQEDERLMITDDE